MVSRRKKNIFNKKFFSAYKRTLRRKTKHFGNIFKKHSRIYYSLLILILTFVISFVVLQTTLLSEKYKIETIKYSKESVEKYDNPFLFKKIKEKIKGKKFYLFNFLGKDELIKKLKKEYPILKDIQIQLNGNNKVVIDPIFHKPNLVFHNGKDIIGTYAGNFIEFSSGSNLLSGKTFINLPDYLTKKDNWSGFFYKISEKKLKFQFEQIKRIMGKKIEKIKYLPGGSKTIIHTRDEKKIYINNLKSISEQFRKYKDLRDNYENFSKLKEIDLGSTQKVIIKKS